MTNIFTEIPAGAEVLPDTFGDSPDTMFRAGQREAAKRTAQGVKTECLGVLETVSEVSFPQSTGHWFHQGQGLVFPEMRTRFAPRKVFKPILTPALPVE